MDWCVAFWFLVAECVLLWLKLVNLAALLLGVVIVIANLWVVAARSTIPLALDAQVLSHETRREKHSGHDDVYLLHLAPGGQLQVDAHVFDGVMSRQRIRKSAWDRQLLVGENKLPLRWSTEFQGLARARPLSFAVLLVVAGWAWLSMR